MLRSYAFNSYSRTRNYKLQSRIPLLLLLLPLPPPPPPPLFPPSVNQTANFNLYSLRRSAGLVPPTVRRRGTNKSGHILGPKLLSI